MTKPWWRFGVVIMVVSMLLAGGLAANAAPQAQAPAPAQEKSPLPAGDKLKGKGKPKSKDKSKAKDNHADKERENRDKITKLCHPKQTIKVLWKGQWRDAEVLKKPTRDGRCYIHFKGWDKKLDEWVTGNRIKSAEVPPEPAAETAKAPRPPAAGSSKTGDKPAEKPSDKASGKGSNATPIGSPAKCPEGKPAKVKWKEKWYDALIRKGPDKIGRCFIHYEGWDNTWDEWVTPDRIRL